jgi:hypothetical protein
LSAIEQKDGSAKIARQWRRQKKKRPPGRAFYSDRGCISPVSLGRWPLFFFDQLGAALSFCLKDGSRLRSFVYVLKGNR